MSVLPTCDFLHCETQCEACARYAAAGPLSLFPELKPRPFDLAIDMLTEDQAYALAELCKRIGWSDCRALAVSDDECRNMIQAVERVRGGLEQIGVRVR